MDKSTKKHEDLVSKVVKELKNRGYYAVYEHITYSDGKRCGEIDVFARKYNNYLVFEIKGYDSISHYNKAKKQLKRAERYCFNKGKCFLFYVSGDRYGNPQYKRIK